MHTLISAVVANKASDRVVTVDAGATVAEAVAAMVSEHVGARASSPSATCSRASSTPAATPRRRRSRW